MSLEQVALIASIVSSVAVIASLIFVGIQLKQNSLATRIMTSQINTQIMIDNFGRIIDHTDIAAIFAGERSPKQVTPAETLRIGNIFAATFRHFEMLHMHQRYGIHEREMWEASEARLQDRIQSAIIRGWWQSSKSSYAPSFVTFVDEKIAAHLEANPDEVVTAPFQWVTRPPASSNTPST